VIQLHIDKPVPVLHGDISPVHLVLTQVKKYVCALVLHRMIARSKRRSTTAFSTLPMSGQPIANTRHKLFLYTILSF